MTLSVEQSAAVYEKYARLLAEGKEDEAGKYIGEQLPNLPEDLRNKIIALMLNQSVIDEARELETIHNIQEAGLAAAEKLEELKKNLQEEK